MSIPPPMLSANPTNLTLNKSNLDMTVPPPMNLHIKSNIHTNMMHNDPEKHTNLIETKKEIGKLNYLGVGEQILSELGAKFSGLE